MPLTREQLDQAHRCADPTGYAISHVYDDAGQVAALRLDRIEPPEHLGDFPDRPSLDAAVEQDQSAS